ncbi:hypothetical protein B0O80DRAFT_499914 [Mortierella sp. GBAus27b]|nr:hypothetical protein B0O80DRAFT_499914 [Mortierella sp. GBAus27b]
MIPSLFNKLNITLLGAATTTSLNPSHEHTHRGRNIDGSSSPSQGLSQLSLNEYTESNEGDDDNHESRTSISDSDQESFQDIMYEDSDDGFSDWSIPSTVPASPAVLSPTMTLPSPLTQQNGGFQPFPTVQDKEPDQELVQLQEQREEKQGCQEEQGAILVDCQEEQMGEHSKQQSSQQLQLGEHDEEHQCHYQQQYYELRLPLDVWIRICSHLYPSQLTRISLANKAVYNLVASLDNWEAWYKQLHGKAHTKINSNSESTSRQAMHIMQPLPGLPKSHSYMLFMCAISRQVCEVCLRRCDGMLHRERLASMPLPVEMPPANQYTNSDHTGSVNTGLQDVENMEDKGNDRIWTIRMCKHCRVLHYESHLEPIPQDLTTSFLTKNAIREKYHLGHKEIREITTRSRGGPECGMPVTYSESAALMQSRQVYGGDVGRLAVPKSLRKYMHVLNNRVYMFNLRRQLTEAGESWNPHE